VNELGADFDIVIVGAGPVGLSMALHARRRGLRAVIVDKGRVANHLLEFPVGMAFFTPRYSLELQGIPLASAHLHATREEIISYYQRLARLAKLEIHGDRCFERLDGSDGAFTAITRTRDGDVVEYRCRKVVLATGVFGHPRRLPPIEGATLDKVSYLYREPYSYSDRDVLLVGAGNSSAGAALALHHAGARVTVLDRNASIPSSKWRWHLDDLQDLIRSQHIRLLHHATLERIEPKSVTVLAGGERHTFANDAVIALLGFEPDVSLLENVGIHVDPSTKMPRIDARTLATEVPGLYLAGIVCSGFAPDKIFVWGARHHPKAIIGHILGEPPLDEIADRGVNTVVHWLQFERLADELDETLALALVPVVTGDMPDDIFDVYEYASRTTNLYAEAPSGLEQKAASSIGPILDALDGWHLTRNADGSVVYKGHRLSANAFEILKRCDGTRRISEIVDELAAEYDQEAHELRAPVLKLLLSMLRTGRLTWRVETTHARVDATCRVH
jgi:thioredoxin reductase (NADPH)